MDVSKRNLLIYGYLRESESNDSLSCKIPKEINKMIEMHYPLRAVFEKFDDAQIIISDDGLSATTGESTWRTIRFGDFLHYGDRIRFDVVFDTKDCIPTHIGIGCVTSQFVQVKEPHDYNYGNNHSMWIDGNGYFVNSKKDFGEKYKGNKTSTLPGVSLAEFKSFFKKDDLVHLQIDMIDRKIRIWNDSNEKEENKALFEMDAPDSIAAMVDLCPHQKVTVASQSFCYESNKKGK